LIQRDTMSEILVDTSFIIAFMDKKDRQHKRALEIYGKIEEMDIEVVFMDCVINEVYSVMARKLIERKMSKEFPKVADMIANFLKDINVVNAYRYLPKFHFKVVDLMKQTEGRFNYHDALIALCCREEGIDKIVTLDNDFDEIEWLQRICQFS